MESRHFKHMKKLPDGSFWYTVVPSSRHAELQIHVIEIESTLEVDEDKVAIVSPEYIRIDSQQLGELGLLFTFLADDFDYDSVTELIDGYGFSDEDIDKFKVRLKEMSERM